MKLSLNNGNVNLPRINNLSHEELKSGDIVIMYENSQKKDICVVSYNKYLTSLEGSGTVYKTEGYLQTCTFSLLNEDDSVKLEKPQKKKYNKS